MEKKHCNQHQQAKDISSRKDAIKKMGKYATLTALGTFMVLNPLSSQSGSLPAPEPNPFEDLN